MNNLELLNKIIETAEKNHINLYHDITKEQLTSHIAKIKNINTLTNLQFDYQMLKIFAMFKDAHTRYFIPFKNLSHKLMFEEGKLFLKLNNDYFEISKIAGLTQKQLINKLKPLIAYETTKWLNEQIRSEINNGYYFEMFNLITNNGFNCEYITSSGIKSQTITLVEQINNIPLSDNKYRCYEHKLLDNNILLIKYKRCNDNPDYPFATFVNEIESLINANDVKKFILDLRNNHGGDSKVIKPLKQLLKRKKLNGVLLINEGVFSSGRFAVAEFKEAFNTPLIGEGTGGAAKSYGYNKNLTVENKRFSVSIRLWDFSDVFGYTGSIKPDIFVPTTIADFKNKTDTQLKTAIDYLNNH